MVADANNSDVLRRLCGPTAGSFLQRVDHEDVDKHWKHLRGGSYRSPGLMKISWDYDNLHHAQTNQLKIEARDHNLNRIRTQAVSNRDQ